MSSAARYRFDPTDAERSRLRMQAEVYRSATERLLLDAGLSRDGHVLDVGCGTGDVAFLAADVVGAGGRVVGVDVEQSMIDDACRSARERGLDQVEFRVADLLADSGERFDVVVGRFVLAQQPDPVRSLRHLGSLARPGGVVALMESGFNFRDTWSDGRLPLYDDMVRRLMTVTHTSGHDHHLGANLATVFAEAGLPPPGLRVELPIGGHDSDVLGYMLTNMAVMFPQGGPEAGPVPTAAEFDELSARIVRDAEAAGALVLGQCVVAAWSTVG